MHREDGDVHVRGGARCLGPQLLVLSTRPHASPLSAPAGVGCLHAMLGGRMMEGPDHKASLQPDQFASMVQGIRTVEKALGDGIKAPTVSEIANLSIARKSIVAARNINVGEHFSAENITTKRPGTGISPMHWDLLLGNRATRAYVADELIEW